MRKTISVFVALFAWTSCHATTILVLYTPMAVFFGADSKLVVKNWHVSPAQPHDAGLACKIHVSNNVVWASAGFLAETNGPFDLRTVADDVLRDATSFSDAVHRLDSEVARQYPAFRKRSIEAGAKPRIVGTDVAISGFESSMRLTLLRFGSSYSEIDCPGEKCSELGYVSLGVHQRIDSILSRNGYAHRIWKQKGIPEAIRYLISAEEAASPELVGGPISILQLDESGPHWITRGACN